MRYCLPRVRGKGEGLGNELIAWSRAFLAAQVLGVKVLPPAFGLNQRRYWRHFDTPRYDWILQRALYLALPIIEFREKDYWDYGGGDMLLAFREFAEAKRLFDRSTYLITTEGMWGGYSHIKHARNFIISTLYNSQFAAHNLFEIQRRLSHDKLVVAMHVRLGDFGASIKPIDYQGKFNIALPLDWYINVGQNIQHHYGNNVQFLIASDGTSEQLKPLTERLPCILTTDIEDSDCSDLLALVQADLLVCSVSSFSACAAFLSDAPYLWYEPQLQTHIEGYYSIWGNQPLQQSLHGPTKQAIESWQNGLVSKTRGWPVGVNGKIPDEVFDQMDKKFLQRQSSPQADLVMFGVVPRDANL